MSWRDACRPIIARVLADTKGQPEKAIRKALRDAYPFGEREMWPYKVWCDEVRRQRGTWKPAKPRNPSGRERRIEEARAAGGAAWELDLLERYKRGE